MAADQVEEERGLLSGDPKSLMREGRDHTSHIELRQDGGDIDQRGEGGLQPLFPFVVARADDRLHRGDLFLDAPKLFLQSQRGRVRFRDAVRKAERQ